MNYRANGERRFRRTKSKTLSAQRLQQLAADTEVRRPNPIDRYQIARPIWGFGLRFVGLMLLFYLMVPIEFCDRLLYAYLAANARLANEILNCLGQDSHVFEVTIRSARFAISVRRGCDAVEPAWLFCAAVISFPAPIGRKLAGMSTGAAFLLLLNLVRIVTLYFIGLHFPLFFGPVHLEVWPAIFVVAAILLWIGWIEGTRRTATTTRHVPA